MPEKSRPIGTPNSISRWIIFWFGSVAQPVFLIIWYCVRNVVTIMIAINTPATIRTLVVVEPRQGDIGTRRLERR